MKSKVEIESRKYQGNCGKEMELSICIVCPEKDSSGDS
jgi:hypothetical protein